MYITINGTQYPCANYRDASGVSASFVGVTGLTLPISGEVTLHADDGFELARQSAGAYTRQTYENGVLTLTNIPVIEVIEQSIIIDTNPTQIDIYNILIDQEYRLILLEMGVK